MERKDKTVLIIAICIMLSFIGGIMTGCII